MGLSTPLRHKHEEMNAKMVDFHGWEMPLHYGSQIDEHHQVRQHAGMFDVSHMGIVDIGGDQAAELLGLLLANDADKLNQPGKAIYSCMLNPQGGILDDLIVYRIDEQQYRIVWNSATREKNIKWLYQHAKEYDVLITERSDLAMIAVQGPKAIDLVTTVMYESFTDHIQNLKPFTAFYADYIWVARTGYTGEKGVEIILPAESAAKLWQAFADIGIQPCGLGARDTLRLEAGLNLYGTDMDESTHPFESNLGWTVDLKAETRNFIGRQALEEQQQRGISHQFVGVMMESPGVLRNHQAVYINDGIEGTITSGGFSPTLGHAIALARLPLPISGNVYIERRGKQIPVTLIELPFVRNGKKICKPLNQEANS
ncbi:MAG: glycine cleavage system aminomethyltransferase GcvT [Coxiellaceae bacterium]|nr:glycine cleavage system aminomethyltransferase GcvT [Coxiellaceae bacterium]